MWGSWLTLVAGAAAILLLGVALIVGASPLFAVLILIVVGIAAAAIMLVKRGAGHAQAQATGGEALRGRDASGAPAAGEGGPPTAAP